MTVIDGKLTVVQVFAPDGTYTETKLTHTYRVIDAHFAGANGYNSAIVAVAGCNRDWAAYMGGYPAGLDRDTAAQWVAQHGDKIPEKIARALFPPAVGLRWRD